MMILKRRLPDWIVPLIWGTVVIALTTLPTSVSVISSLKHVVIVAGHPNLNDAIGHGSLYGTLMAAIYWSQRRHFSFEHAFKVALIGTLMIGFSTEMLQHFSPGRDVQLSDLLANWLGAMTAAALIGYYQSGVSQRLQRML